MSYKVRGKCDGTGSYRNSYRKKVEGKKLGRRQEAGEECPYGWEEEDVSNFPNVHSGYKKESGNTTNYIVVKKIDDKWGVLHTWEWEEQSMGGEPMEVGSELRQEKEWLDKFETKQKAIDKAEKYMEENPSSTRRAGMEAPEDIDEEVFEKFG